MGKKDNQAQLQYLMEKLYQIDKELGGTAKKRMEQKGSEGEFENIYQECKQLIYLVKKNIEELEKNKNRDKAVIIQEQEIRDQLYQCQNFIKQMNDVLTNQAKKPKVFERSEVQKRDKLYNLLRQELNILLEKRGLQQDTTVEMTNNQQNIITFSEMKKNLVAGGHQQQVRAEANDIELQALDDFRKKDELQDQVLDRINENADVLKGKALQMGEGINQVGDKVKNLSKKVDDAEKQLQTSNKRMKDVILKYRAPNKFCLDMVLIFFLLALVGVIYTMFK